MKVKKIITLAAIGTVSLTAAFLYLQYDKIKKHAFKVKTFVVNSVSLSLLDFDLYLIFTNNSSLKFTIKSQVYKIYVNNNFVSNVSNANPVLISPNASTEFGVNVRLHLSDLFSTIKLNVGDILTRPQKIPLRIDLKMNVSFYGIPFSIPYTYETNLKDILDRKKNKDIQQ